MLIFPAWQQYAWAWSRRAVGGRPQATECPLFRCPERAWPLEMLALFFYALGVSEPTDGQLPTVE